MVDQEQQGNARLAQRFHLSITRLDADVSGDSVTRRLVRQFAQIMDEQVGLGIDCCFFQYFRIFRQLNGKIRFV